MKQRYNDLNLRLCEQAALEAYDRKWHRGDFLRDAEKYSGVPRSEILYPENEGDLGPKLEVTEGIACEMMERLCNVMSGAAEDLDLQPVRLRKRRDGISGKVREIASCCPMHQCFGHLLVLGLKPLLHAKLLPCQHASIPGHGQTACKRQIQRALRSGKLGIRHAVKTDVIHAYGSTQGDVVYRVIAGEIPRAKWILVLLELLLGMNPNGSLLIGGYPDAWLFNLVMSYALRQMLNMRKSRRGSTSALVKACPDYMDDAVPMGSRLADIRSAIRSYAQFIHKHFGLEIKVSGKVVSWLAIADEARRGRAPTPGGRGCPGLDMAGFVVRRSYTTIRPIVFLRARRQLLRAAREVEETGTMPLWRAQRIVSYAGFYDQSNSRKAVLKYGLGKLRRIATHVVAYHNRIQQQSRVRSTRDQPAQFFEIAAALPASRRAAGA